MRIRELKDERLLDSVSGIIDGVSEKAKSIFESVGSTIAQGATQELKPTRVKLAQFPAERNAANDSTQDFRVNDLYKNGLLFTAYQYTGRTSGDLRSFRNEKNTATGWSKRAISKASIPTQDTLVNILLPRGQTDVDSVSHKFNDVGESLVGRGGGTITGALSSMASHAVFGALDSLTQGIMADKGEQIYNSSRSMYAGAENRTKTYVWHMTPRNIYDLIEIIRIYDMFVYYSYGQSGTSKFAKQIKGEVDRVVENMEKSLVPENADMSNTPSKALTSFLTNVNVVSNPVIWTVKNFGQTSSFDARPDMFGPCQIQSVRFDKSPDGQFNGLAIAPNLPSTFVLEVTMREILALNQKELFGGGYV